MTQPLKWRRVGPQDYRATLPDGAEAKVAGKYVDDRDYDGGDLTGWQWTAEVGGQFVTPYGVTLPLMRDAKAAVQQYVDRAGADKTARGQSFEPGTTVRCGDGINRTVASASDFHGELRVDTAGGQSWLAENCTPITIPREA